MAAYTDVEPTPIAQLSPELSAVPSAVRGVVTIIWPYSSVSDLFAFILAESDLRLRRPKGQVRVNLYGPSAKAIVATGLSSGDLVLLSLEGVEWEPAEANRRLSGAGLEWQLKFTNKAQLQVTDAETNEAKTVQVDPLLSMVEDAQPENPILTVSDAKDLTPPPPGLGHFTPAKSGPVRSLVDGEFESPAFVKRARVSYGSLFEDGFDIFDEDGGARGRGRKRARFGRPSGAWRYTSQSPSPEREPEPEVSVSEHDDEEMAGSAEATVKPGHETSHSGPSTTKSEGLRASSPARPQMTDEACQTVETDLPATLAPSAVSAADDRGSAQPPPTPDVPAAASSHDISLDQSQQPVDFGAWPDDATMAMPSFTDADKFAQGPLGVESLNPDLQLGGPFHQSWMSHDNYLEHSHSYSEMPTAAENLPPQSGFGSGFTPESTSNLAAVRFGFGDSSGREVSLSPRPGHDMNTHGLPLEAYPPIEGQDQPSPFAQATTNYPPLDADGRVILANTAPQPNATPFLAPSLTEATRLSREDTSIPDPSHPDTQTAFHRADASIPAWSATESDSHSAPQFPKEKSASTDSHTPEPALVIDHSGSDSELENGRPDAGVIASLADHGYDPVAVDFQDDEGEAPLEAEVGVEYPVDEEPEYDEDDIGDYDTRQYTGPDDDEDDSHDEDLRPRSLEEPFDDGEEEEEEEEEDFDEDEPGEDDDDDEYESDAEMGNGPPNSQRQPPSASSAPVVIDLLSSDEEEDENPQTFLSSKPLPSNVHSVPSRPAPVRTSPEYGPASEEEEGIEDEDGQGDDDDDDDQASSDGEDSQVEEYMSESYRDSSGPEDSADDSDGAEDLREGVPRVAREIRPVTPTIQAIEPEEKAGGEQELPQQATSPDIPADTDATALEAVDEEMQDVQAETEHSNSPSPADKDVELRDSNPIEAVETRGPPGDNTAELKLTNPLSSKEAETTERSQENASTADKVQLQADSPALLLAEHVEEDKEMADAPTVPSSPLLTQPFTSHVVDEKHEVVMQNAPTGNAEEAETQPPTPMGTQQLEVSISHESIARATISTGKNDAYTDTPAEAGSETSEVDLKESVVIDEEQVFVANEFRSTQRAPSTDEQVDTTLETSITVATARDLETGSELGNTDAVKVPVATPSQLQGGAQDEREVDDSGASSVPSPSDNDDALQALLREEHLKMIEVDDGEPSLFHQGAPTHSPDAEIAAASSPYGDDAYAQEFQSAASSVHEHAAEDQDFRSEAPDTSTEQPEFSDAMEVQEHYEDATSYHGDQQGPASVQTNDAFSDASTGYTSQPPPKPRAFGQRVSTREDIDDDRGEDPSVQLARAAIASRRGTRRRDATPDTTHTSIRTRSSYKSSSPDFGDDSVQIARASLNTPSKVVSKTRSVPRSTSPASSKMDEDTNSVKEAKMKLVRHIRDQLPDCTKLGVLRQHYRQSVDVMAVALMAPPEPRRAKGGPREYLMSFTITDYSIGPTSVAEVQLYRPHKDSLPKVKAGDVVLLRSFAVAALRGKGYGLQTSEVSSWAVFDKEGEPPQIRGPPVEYGEAENTYAEYLREWFGLLDEKAKEKLSKANQKILDAAKAK